MGDGASRASLWHRDFAWACLATVAVYLSHQLILPVFPLHVEEVIGDASDAGLLNGVLLAFSGLGTLTIPILMAVWGRKIAVAVGMTLFAVSVVSYIVFGSLLPTLVATIFRGLGFGIGNAALLTVVVDVIPVHRRGDGLGAYQLAVAIGGLAGAGGGLYLWERFGFSTVALLAGLVGLGAAAAVSMMQGVLGRGTRQPSVGHLRAVRALGHLRSPAAVFALLTFCYGGIVTFAALFVIAEQLGSPATFFFVMTSAQVIGRPTAGRLCDRANPAMVLIGMLLVVLAGLLLLSVAHAVPMLTQIGAALFGMGFGGGVTSSQVVLMQGLDADGRPIASAVFGVAYSWGMGVGAALCAVAVSLFGYRAIFPVMALVICAAVAVTGVRAGRAARTWPA